jgi:hypothetical protein
MSMTRHWPFLALLVFALLPPIMPAQAQSLRDDNYNIIAPEPGTTPKHTAPAPRGKKRIGSSSPVYPTPLPPPLHYNPPPALPVPPSMYVPQTGQVVPNLPSVTGSGSGGGETFQDRAIRCANQAGVYGPGITGDRNTYIGGCINQ